MKPSTSMGAAALLGVSLVLVGGGAYAASKQAAPLARKDCKATWKLAAPMGEALSKGKAEPFILDFTMVDTNHNGEITATEFKQGCKDGWVKSANAATVKDMKK
jgi:hypothetical protein